MKYFNYVKTLNFGVGDNISDLSTLDGLPNLGQLDASYNKITDSSILKHKSLIAIDLADNHIEDISCLKYNTTLRRLDLSRNRVTCVESLKYNTTLNHLTIYKCDILDITPLFHSTSLVEVEYHDIPFLKKICGLNRLNMGARHATLFNILYFKIHINEFHL